ncbi:MAG TPA: amidohydrolase family protein, partial [Pyrinomonadaceae bacterium]|nr:amidohydrolase family protein [Pyrinomonadaceae bacterium]
EELNRSLSDAARRLLDAALDSPGGAPFFDYHTHVVGTGANGTGTFVNPRMLTWRHPGHRLKLALYRSAAGVGELEDADREYVERLVRLARGVEADGRHGLLAFDKHHRRDGTPDLEKTEFYVPNDYVFALAERFPEKFAPVASVNPYRADALEELRRCASRGARVVKWLPNAMGIDPADELCDPFYQTMRELGLVLLSHGGEEKAVEAEEDQKLGNPLRLRRALEHGVRVVVAHCAGLGQGEDLDAPGRPARTNFDLFLRLMGEPRYEGLLFADISAMTQFNRAGFPLRTVLEREDLHPRLVNGSDYPLPAFNVLIRTGALVRAGYIAPDERRALNEVYDYNPLLFDLALKRTLKAPGTGRRLPASIFTANPALS